MRNAAFATAVLLAAAACTPQQNAPSSRATQASTNGLICQAFDAQQSHVEVLATGVVTRDLGLRAGRSGTHEGYLLRLDNGCRLVLKVETNVDLTGPIPIKTGDRAVVKGEYEWTRLGGVLHWTHHDPRGRHEGGYVTVEGHTYQ